MDRIVLSRRSFLKSVAGGVASLYLPRHFVEVDDPADLITDANEVRRIYHQLDRNMIGRRELYAVLLRSVAPDGSYVEASGPNYARVRLSTMNVHYQRVDLAEGLPQTGPGKDWGVYSQEPVVLRGASGLIDRIGVVNGLGELVKHTRIFPREALKDGTVARVPAGWLRVRIDRIGGTE